jgi:N-methylhydantoinase A
VQRGYDPRDFVLVAFGGAGPVHANRLAAETEIATTLIPPGPGLFSALGLLVSDLKHDYSASVMQRADRLDLASLTTTLHRLEADGRTALTREAVAVDDMMFQRQAELRYAGQSFELTVPLPGGVPGPDTIASSLEAFHREHERAYGYSAPAEPVEWVNVRLTAFGRIAKPRLRDWPTDGTTAAAQKTSRPVYFAECKGPAVCPIFDRNRLPAGAVIAGPAVIEEMDATTVIHPGYQGRVDRFGNLLLTEALRNTARPANPSVG